MTWIWRSDSIWLIHLRIIVGSKWRTLARVTKQLCNMIVDKCFHETSESFFIYVSNSLVLILQHLIA